LLFFLFCDEKRNMKKIEKKKKKIRRKEE